MNHSSRRQRQLSVRVLVVVLLVGFALTTFFVRSSSALGRAFAASEESDTTAEVPAIVLEDDTQTTDLTAETPLPNSDETFGQTTPEPAESATPQATDGSTPTPTPEPTETAELPTELREALFQGASAGAETRVSTQLTLPTEAVLSLSLSRLTAQSDATAYEPYRARLSEALSPELAQNYIAYELRYSADGGAIVPELCAADLTLSDKAQQFAADTDSVRVFYLLCGEDSSMPLHSATARVVDGALSMSLPSCPGVILVERQATNDATPAPETTPDPALATPEPSPSTSPLPVYEYDCDGLYVSGSPASSTVLPEGAVLSALRITSENSPERYAKYAEMLQALYNTDFPIAFNAYDISFHADGQEVEPVGDVVNVTIRDASFAQAVEAPLVYHVVDEQGAQPALEAIPATEDTTAGEEQVAFSADSFSVFLILADGSTISVSEALSTRYKIIASAADTFTHTSYYNASRKLGIAGNFHIVAFDTATLIGHTNGNVLAKNLKAGSNFGTKNLADELSYVQNYLQISGVSASKVEHVLVIGEAHGTTNVITAADNGSAFAISDIKIDSPNYLWQDLSTTTLPFVDLAAVKASCESLSSSLKGNGDAYTKSYLSSTGGSCNASYILLQDANKVGFYNIKAEDVVKLGYFGVKGFESGHSGTVIVNVDCEGYSSPITLPECQIFYGASTAPVSLVEVTDFVNGRILWNFFHCTTTVNTTKVFYASILAPDATITTDANLNGTIIANNVTIGGESHRDDFIGDVQNGVTVTGNKVWSDYGTGAPANTSVTFQLYCSTGGAPSVAYGTPVTLNSTTGWSHNWLELPTGSLYTIVETTVMCGSTDLTASYAATYSTQTGVASGSITVTNQYLYTLPETGGAGTWHYYTLGICLVSLTAALILLYREGTARKRARRHRTI